MKLTKTRWYLALVCASLAVGTPAHAEDAAPKTETGPTGPTAYQGKILVVDKNFKTITVEIDKELYLFQATAQTRLFRKGKAVAFKDIAAGQSITLVLQKPAKGDIEVVSLSIEKTSTDLETAGTGKSAKKHSATPPDRE
ncbi:MAG TPA: hypothetical protein VMZ27_01230 [Candidatus Saccharimonadales bacterium]|nr:hypothetical protein [Candidatus Saccharimonadales bacterium]